MKDVTRRLRVLRAGKGLSQMVVAERAHLALNRYWRIENGYADPSSIERAAIARALDVPTVEAFPEAVAS